MSIISTSYIHTTELTWILRFTATILTLSCIFIFIYHTIKSCTFIKTVHGENTATQSDIGRILTHLFTSITLFWYSVMGTNMNLNLWSIYTTYNLVSCDVYSLISVSSYHLAKGFLYLVLILRLKTCFHDSIYYNKLKSGIITVSVILFMYIIIAIWGDIVYVSGSMITIPTDININYCLLNKLPLWTIGTMLAFDMIISITCLLLFNYPLRDLIKNSFRDEKFTELIQKYAILTTIAILSTVILIGIQYITQIGVLMLIDNIINALCVILMSSWYNKYYKYLCCWCDKTVNKCKYKNRNRNDIGTKKDSNDNDSSNISSPNSNSVHSNNQSSSNDGRTLMINTSQLNIVSNNSCEKEYKSNLRSRHSKHLDTVDFTEMILNNKKNIIINENNDNKTQEITFMMDDNDDNDRNDIDSDDDNVLDLKFTGNIQESEKVYSALNLAVIDNIRPSLCEAALPQIYK